MADTNNKPPDILTNNEVLGEADANIKRILLYVGSRPHSELIDLLIEDEDETLLIETRDLIFKKAIERFAWLTSQARGMTSQMSLVDLEMKDRRGDHKLQSYARDIITLYAYYVDLAPDFPKEVLKSTCTYFDGNVEHIQAQVDQSNGNNNGAKSKSNNDGTGQTTPSNTQDKCSCSHAELLKLALNRNEHLERSHANLKAYVLSVEAMLRDEISAVRFIAEDAARAANEHKPRPQPPPPPPSSPKPTAAEAGVPSSSEGAPGQAERDPSSNGTQTAGPASAPGNAGAQAKGSAAPHPAPQNGAGTTETRKTYAEQATSPTKPVFLNPRSQQQVKDMNSTPNNTQNSSNGNNDSSKSSKTDSSDKKHTKLSGPKPTGTSNGSSIKVPLSGVKQKKTCDLYVQDIARYSEDKFIDIANRVREHCLINDIRVSYARVYPKKFCADTVNCRISVPIEDADNALGIRIWPDGVVCRRWNKDPPRRTPIKERQSRSPGRSKGPRSILRSRSRSRVRYDDEYENYNHDDRYYDGYEDRYYSYYDRS